MSDTTENLLAALERLTETIIQQKGIAQGQIKEGSALHQAQQAIAAARETPAWNWKPINEIPMREYRDYSTSGSVLLAEYFPQTNWYKILIGRIWEESGKRIVIDHSYAMIERITHYMPLPQHPAKENAA
jgi:hypothetical protein